MEITQTSLLEKVNHWIRESIMVKLGSIGFLILILMIPQVWIESLIRERQERANSVVDEVACVVGSEANESVCTAEIHFPKA